MAFLSIFLILLKNNNKKKYGIYPGQEEKLSDIFLPPLWFDSFIPLPTVSGWFSFCDPWVSSLFFLIWNKVPLRKKKEYIYSYIYIEREIAPSFQPTTFLIPLGTDLPTYQRCQTNTFTLGCWDLCTYPSPPPISSWHHVDANNAAFNLHAKPARGSECLLSSASFLRSVGSANSGRWIIGTKEQGGQRDEGCCHPFS